MLEIFACIIVSKGCRFLHFFSFCLADLDFCL